MKKTRFHIINHLCRVQPLKTDFPESHQHLNVTSGGQGNGPFRSASHVEAQRYNCEIHYQRRAPRASALIFQIQWKHTYDSLPCLIMNDLSGSHGCVWPSAAACPWHNCCYLWSVRKSHAISLLQQRRAGFWRSSPPLSGKLLGANVSDLCTLKATV